MSEQSLQEYKDIVAKKIQDLLPVFARAAVGDFSTDIEIPDEEDAFTPLYVGLQVILEVIREKIAEVDTRRVKTELEKVRDEAILNNIGEGLIATDKEGLILMFNKTAEELLGVPADVATGKALVQIVEMEDEHGHVVAQEQRPMARVLSTGEKISGTFTYIRSDMTKFFASMTVTPLLLNGQVVGGIEVFRDVTAEKELDRLRDEFVSMSSHELRTPMTAIKGFMSMIFRGDFGPVNEGLKTPLHTIANSTERLISLVNNLLDVSRIESKRIQYELTDFPITDLISQVTESLYPLAVERGATISPVMHQDIVVQADPDKVKQIMHNLIGNALKFSDKGTVTITVEEKEQEVNVFIKDTGLGISKEDIKNLFKKFHQITSQQEGRPIGTGLGLYISSQLAKNMGGRLWLEESIPGQGSTFALSLPLSGTKSAESVWAKLSNDGVLTDIVVGSID